MHDEASGHEDSEEDCTVNEVAKVGVWGWQRWGVGMAKVRCGDGKDGVWG